MTPKDQQLAIADFMPCNLIHYEGEEGLPLLHVGGDRFIVFDPLNDLNAINAAVMELKDRDFKSYMRYQQELIKQDGLIYTDAAASNRSVAFLKATGLWK